MVVNFDGADLKDLETKLDVDFSTMLALDWVAFTRQHRVTIVGMVAQIDGSELAKSMAQAAQQLVVSRIN